MALADSLLGAREALAQHAWADAYELLKRADEEIGLDPDDLAGLGEAAWWVGRIKECIDARSRAFAGCVAQGRKVEAGLLSLRLAEDHFHRLEGSISRGWLARAERLLSEDETSVGFGWLARTRALIAFEGEGDIDKALHWAERGLEIAAAGDRDLYALSLHDKGRLLIAQGRIDEGMPLMEEAMVAAIGGELGAMATGRIYCNMIDICEKMAEYGRAAQWDQAAQQWCERVGITSGFPGICRVKRAGIMLFRGRWHEAEDEARRATEELSDFLTFAAVGFKEIGEIRLRMGDLEGAEQAFLQANQLGHDPQPGLALLRLAQGHPEAARQMVTTALAQDSLIDLQRAKLLPALVEICLAEGDLPAADAAAKELGTLAARFGSKAILAAAAFSEGGVALARGEVDSAVEMSRRASRLWADEDLPYEAARARLQTGEAYRRGGSAASAAMELDAARRAFQELGAILLLRRLERLLEGGSPARRVWAMMLTDIVGSTELIRTIGDSAWTQLVSWHDRTLRHLFEEHGGREQDHAGDGFFVLFPTPSQAVDCAIAIQRTMQSHRTDAGFAPELRIGVHVAEVNQGVAAVTGLEVHKAARIGALAAGGEVIISRQVAEELGSGYRLSEAFEATVKGAAEPVTVMGVIW